MQVIPRKFIDWKKTGKNLELLRIDNIELRRSVCSALKHGDDCAGRCADCKFEMDNHISRNELAEVFGVSESVIYNWETGRTCVDLENILFYSQISNTELEEIIVFI